ncbi:hypothetical protein DIPPA_04984 [Diplonema papillatum]|nr:hypothetical protein DIPPA_04984 [Diplonema papillatum]
MAAIPPSFGDLMKPVKTVLGEGNLAPRIGCRTEGARNGLHVVTEHYNTVVEPSEGMSPLRAKVSATVSLEEGNLPRGMKVILSPVMLHRDTTIDLSTTAKLTGLYPGLSLGGQASTEGDRGLNASFAVPPMHVQSSVFQKGPGLQTYKLSFVAAAHSMVHVGAQSVFKGTIVDQVTAAVAFSPAPSMFIGASVTDHVYNEPVLCGWWRPHKSVAVAFESDLSQPKANVSAGAVVDVDEQHRLHAHVHSTPDFGAACSLSRKWNQNLTTTLEVCGPLDKTKRARIGANMSFKY